MQEIDLISLDTRLQVQVTKANRAIADGQPGYAMDICLQILKGEPGCLPVRKILRKAQKANLLNNHDGPLKVLEPLRTLADYFCSKVFSGKNPQRTLEIAEQILKRDIENISARRMLASAANSLGLEETRLFALEEIRNYRPRDINNLLALGNAYLSLDMLTDAEMTGDSILKLEPTHGAARNLVKRASVSRTIQSGERR